MGVGKDSDSLRGRGNGVGKVSDSLRGRGNGVGKVSDSLRGRGSGVGKVSDSLRGRGVCEHTDGLRGRGGVRRVQCEVTASVSGRPTADTGLMLFLLW